TRGAGTASATVRSSLADEGAQTKVVVHTSMNVTGRPAQFGRGVMAEVSGRIIEKFATNLAALLASAPAAGVAASNGSGPGPDAPGPGAGSGDGAAGTATIEELGLPVRAYNSLRRVGIHTVDDLSARTEADLLGIENLGPQSVREIKERLAGIGRHLAEQAAGAPAAAAGADGSSADGVGAGAPAPRAARPPDEDAIDLLSVAGFPVLKRALPVLAAVAILLLVIFGLRRGRRGD